MNRSATRVELGAMLVVALALLVGFFTVLPLDHTLASRMQSLADPLLTTVLREVSVFGNGVIELLLIASAAGLLIWRKRRLEALFVVATTLSSGTLGTIMKIVVARPRPTLGTSNSPLWQLFGRYSFPSGHAVFFTAFFGALAFLLWHRFRGRLRWVGIGVCLLLIVLVGPSRVYLGAHWPSDVMGGYLVGSLCLFAVILLYQWRYGW